MESSELFIKTNEVNSNVTELLFKEYWKSCTDPFDREFFNKEKIINEIKDTFMDFFYSVPFIQNCTTIDRKYAKDLPKDNKGRIIVDITHPHILEDMDYFRPTAICFEEHGVPTLLKPNGNPNSPYGKWIAEEARRCREGYIRESDGEWITGDLYFFWNYCPMLVDEEDEEEGITTRYRRFPSPWEGHYLKAHYIWQARHNDKNGAELASRGRGKTAFAAAMLARRILLGETTKAKKDVTSVAMASDKKFLTGGDVLLDKFQDNLDFCAENTEFPRGRLKDTENELKWEIGYKRNNGPKDGIQNVVFGITSGNTPKKGRGSRASLYILEEFGSWANLKPVYNGLKPSVKQQGGRAHGIIFMEGTAGDSESDFSGAQDLVRNPDGNDIYAVDNVYDKVAQGKKRFTYFFPAYINLSGYYDKEGNSDVVRALLQICADRIKIKYNTDNPDTLIRNIAEYPIVPEEAMLRVQSNVFPTADLNTRIAEIEGEPNALNDVFVGELVMDANGEVSFKTTNDVPIRFFPHKDNKLKGAVEIFEMPQKAPNESKPASNRYISSCLPEGELISTKDGLKRVEDITLDDKLYSIKGNLVNINECYKRNVENETVYKIKLADIYDSVSFTGNHPIYCTKEKKHYHHSKFAQKNNLPYVYRTYDFDFIPAEKVEKNMYVKVPNKYKDIRYINYDLWNESNVRIDRRIENPLGKKDFWWTIGLLLGDGWSSSNGYKIYCTFNAKETDYSDRFKNIIINIFNRHPVLEKSNKNINEISFSHSYFNEFFKKHFGKGAENKHIPEWVKFLPNELKIELIMGYLASDGCVYKTGVEFVSVSKKLLKDIQDILLSLGVISSLTKLRDKSIHNIEGRLCNTKETYHLRFQGKNAKEFISIAYEDYKLKKIDNKKFYNHQVLDAFFEDDSKEYVLYRVRNIEKYSYTGTVYNFNCETHTYMCDYIPVHNCDPVDKDSADSVSLSSTFVLDLYTDKIVAEYTGRKDFAEDAYEVTRRLCLFYNAKCLYENNISGLYGYFSKMNCTYLLADTPDYLKEKDLIKTNSIGNGSKGVRTTVPIINHLEQLIRDWLCKEVVINNQNETGEEIHKTLNLYLIKNLALLKELSQYNRINNFDRVMSLGMLMIYRESMLITFHGEVKQSRQRDDPNYLGNSKFFQQYDRKFRKN